jgi:hypothetical protein
MPPICMCFNTLQVFFCSIISLCIFNLTQLPLLWGSANQIIVYISLIWAESGLCELFIGWRFGDARTEVNSYVHMSRVFLEWLIVNPSYSLHGSQTNFIDFGAVSKIRLRKIIHSWIHITSIEVLLVWDTFKHLRYRESLNLFLLLTKKLAM